LSYGTAPRAPITTAQRIDASLGISTTPPRALLGDVEFTWEDEIRLRSIELRTGRSQWEPSSLRTPSERVEEAAMTLDLDYDVNGVASVGLDVRVLWDATVARIGLRFSDVEPQAGRWAAIADNAFVCIDDEQRLIEVRLANVRIVSEDSA
jgi:hypothetical protein